MFKDQSTITLPEQQPSSALTERNNNSAAATSESLALIANAQPPVLTAESGVNNQSEIKTVLISDIEEHPDFAIRDHYFKEEVELLENNIRYKRTVLPLIVLLLVGKAYYIIDGVYRLLAYKRAGYKEIKAEVFSGSLRDALLLRFEANSRHGKKLEPKERHNLIERFLKDTEWRDFTDTLIASYCGVSDKIVAGVRKEKFPSTSEFPNLRKSIRNGKIIWIDTTNIGKNRSKKAEQLPPSAAVGAALPNSLSEKAASLPNDAAAAGDAGIAVVDLSDQFEQAKTESGTKAEVPDDDETEFDPNLAAQAQGRKKVLLGEAFLVESINTPGRFHGLICGDSTDEKIYQNLSGGYQVGLIATDLPYNRNLKTKIAKGKVAHELHKIANDNLTSSQYRKLLRGILVNSRKITLDGSAFYIFYGLHETIPTYHIIGRELGAIRKLVVWKKNGLRQNWSPDFRDGQECAVFGHIGKDDMRCWYGDKARTTMFDESLYSRSKYELPKKTHPCPKPVPIIANFIELSLEPGGVVFDPLGGGGSTFVAAEVTGRIALSIELTPAFVAVQIERAEKMGLRVTRTTIGELPALLAELSARQAPSTGENGV